MACRTVKSARLGYTLILIELISVVRTVVTGLPETGFASVLLRSILEGSASTRGSRNLKTRQNGCLLAVARRRLSGGEAHLRVII